jgi:hypothetical protein
MRSPLLIALSRRRSCLMSRKKPGRMMSMSGSVIPCTTREPPFGMFFRDIILNISTHRSIVQWGSDLTCAKKVTRGLLSIRPIWARRECFYLSRDFRELIVRFREQGIGLHGLEVFTPMGDLLDVIFSEDGAGSDLTW